MKINEAGVAELVDARDLKSCGSTDNADISCKTCAPDPVAIARDPARLQNASAVVFRPDTSFPFLKIARETGTPYARVLRIVDILDGKDISENIAPDAVVLAISRAMCAERKRRAAVGGAA